jgi:ATP-dependent DNA helicase RecG
MTSAREKLAKILKLEEEQSFRDKAVIGGLARFAETWRKEALQEIRDEAWTARVAQHMQSYSQLETRSERQASLEELQNLLQTGPRRSAVPPERKGGTGGARPGTGANRKPQKQRSEQQDEEDSVKLSDVGLDSPTNVLSGIGPVQSKRLARLGVRTIHDLLYFFPRRYDDFGTLKTINQLEYGEEVTIMGRVLKTTSRKTRSGQTIIKSIIEDGSGTIEATWFNRPHLVKQLKPSRQIVLSGSVDEYLGRLTFSSPEWEPLERELLHTARLVPVYPLTKGVSARWLRKIVKRTIDYWSYRVPDHLPREVRDRIGLLRLEEALRQIHFPVDHRNLEKARYRLAFDELFLIQIGLLRRRQEWQSVPGQAVAVDEEQLQRFVLSLPFALTSAQQQALDEIVQDLRLDRPMKRLLQGDVGSGKTVVATAAIALTVTAGAQAALMAPTEILAEQHYGTLKNLLNAMNETATQQVGEGWAIRLLTGSTSASDREEIYRGLSEGTVDVVIGTHALIQERVEFKSLALAIIDEQHRFGVEQRAALTQKGYNPHLLVMTATPIPRSLALTVYGDLDVSVIDEMPPGRQPIQTRLLLPHERERAYTFVKSQIERGRQAFIICPLVEESEKVEARSAIEEHKRLQKHIFPDLELGLLHGRMKSDEKEEVMAQFVQGELDILVSTAVVEVGIDVPNATVMLVEGANRFGLAQLHQFRGRVGRGEHASYCLLVSDSGSVLSGERLQAIESTQDGFKLAEVDLELRGPGEFFGTRQSGLPDLRMAKVTDMRLLEVARKEAKRLFEANPKLDHPKLRLLVQEVDKFWSNDAGEH